MTEHEHEAPPHDEAADEPLGPLTPDDETPLGDTPEHSDAERVARPDPRFHRRERARPRRH